MEVELKVGAGNSPRVPSNNINIIWNWMGLDEIPFDLLLLQGSYPLRTFSLALLGG